LTEIEFREYILVPVYIQKYIPPVSQSNHRIQ